jgi:UDP-GlcNAc:undecaprenyl-phosphate/decaprenyl-phosphate GlcNAc-1-phosphate transferase
VRDYVLTLLVAAAVTYLLTPLVRRLAGRIGAMKQPRDRDVHVVPVPTIGGLAMYGGLAAGLLIADQISQLRAGLANTGMISGLLLAGGLLVVIGFIDDRWGMDALPKAAGQVAAGGILVATGTSLSWLPLPGGNIYFPTTNQAALLTILIVVATINAVNFIDGLDGLAAGIVSIAAVSFFLYYYTLTRVIDISSLAAPALASAILIGMCLGFLPHNFSPASIFMGDTGSMLLGLLLAYAPISSITSLPPANLTSQINRYPVILPLLLPAALLVIPYGDMLLAVVRRTRAGRSPFAPDRKHLHHRLLDIGHSQRASVLIMYLWAAAFSGTVVGLSIQKTVQHGNSNHHGAPIFVFVIITVIAVAVLLLLSMPRLRWWQRSQPAGSADAGPALESPVLESPVLESTGTAGPRLAGMTGGPALSMTGSGGEAPGRGGLLGRGAAKPGVTTSSFAAAPSAAPLSATPALAAPPSATSPFATSPLSAGRGDELPGRNDQPAPTERSSWHPDQTSWRSPTAKPSEGTRLTPARPDRRMPGLPAVPGIAPAGPALPSTGLPATGLPANGLPASGRSVIGTPPPAVSGPNAIGRARHRTSVWRSETSLPPAADGNNTEPDGLP